MLKGICQMETRCVGDGEASDFRTLVPPCSPTDTPGKIENYVVPIIIEKQKHAAPSRTDHSNQWPKSSTTYHVREYLNSSHPFHSQQFYGIFIQNPICNVDF